MGSIVVDEREGEGERVGEGVVVSSYTLKPEEEKGLCFVCFIFYIFVCLFSCLLP